MADRGDGLPGDGRAREGDSRLPARDVVCSDCQDARSAVPFLSLEGRQDRTAGARGYLHDAGRVDPPGGTSGSAQGVASAAGGAGPEVADRPIRDDVDLLSHLERDVSQNKRPENSGGKRVTAGDDGLRPAPETARKPSPRLTPERALT